MPPGADRGPGASAPVPAAAWAVAYAASVGVLLVVYRPALGGPFLSDDLHYVATNPYVHELSLENLWTILQPWGAATVSVVNYAPLQLLLHSVAWQLFGAEVLGHHVLNLLFHAAGSLLLVALLMSSGIPRAAAALAGGFFLLHPANVEAVAWISQLKTNCALALCLLAVLAHPRRPALGFALFALSLLAKPNAAVALPLAFWLEWVRRGRVRRGWLAAWLVLFAAFAVVEMSAHQRSGAAEATLHATPVTLARTIAALATRYLVLGATSWGVSAFHEPEPARSWLDPWWLASVPALSLLGWRLLVTLRARREEAGFWLAALVSFGPVSQIFPFLYPFADRYLYFILPGLLGGALLAGLELFARVPAHRRAPLARATAVLAIAVLCVFAIRSHERARIWRSSALVQADAAANYPHGVAASIQRAKRAAQANDADLAAAEIRRAMSRGYNRFEQLVSDPGFAPVRDTDPFQAVVRETAKMWIDASAGWDDPTQIELHRIASAHAVRGEHEEAVTLLRRALARGGPIDARIRADLAALGARP